MGKYIPTPEQQDVIDARKSNCLVSAAAGSGKTSVLVDRIMGLITDPVNPIDIDELIVVTFTNAAAAEMKERIEKALDELIEKNEDNPHIARQSGLIENAMITTIDGFCNRFLREHFYLLPYEPNFRILDPGEATLLENDILDATMNEFYEVADPVFISFLEDYATERDDAKIVDIITTLYRQAISSPDPMKTLDSWLCSYSSDKIKSVEDLPFYDKAKSEYDSIVEDSIALIEEATELIKSTPGLEKGIDKYEDALRDIKSLEGASSYADCVARIHGLRKPDAPRFYKPSPELAEIKDKAKDMRTAAYKAIGELSVLFGDDETSILQEHFSLALYVKVLVDITKRYIEALAKEKIKRNVMSFADLSHYSLEIIYDENGKVSDVAKEYGRHFKEIMIDEYQDSNYIQEAILSALADPDCEYSDLFMVGDVKQSIYRFRQAVPKLFIDKFDTYSREKNAKERKLLLTANFRSRSEVTDYANAIFESVMHKDLGGIEYDNDAKLVAKASFDDSLYDNRPEVIIVEDSTGENDRIMLELSAIATRIKRLMKEHKVKDSKTGEMRPLKYSDIVILTRKGTESESMVEGLNYLGIPAASQQGTGYFETLEVNTILSLLSVIDNSKRDIEIVTVLTSPIIGIEHAELVNIKIMPGKSFDDKIKEYIKAGDSEYLKERLVKYRELVNKLKKYASFMNVHEMIRKIYELTDYESYVMFMEGGELRRRNLIMLIEKAKSFETTSYTGLSQFIRYIEKMKKYEVDTQKAQNTDAGDVVTLMTMHKSKGLEFPVVIIARTGSNFGGSNKKPLIQVDIDNGIGLYKYDGKKRTKKTSYAYKCINYFKDFDDHAEELRVLYVALTRAKEKLIITGLDKDYEKHMAGASSKLNEEGKMSHLAKIKATTYLEYILPATIGLADSGKAILDYYTIEEIISDNPNVTEEGELNVQAEERIETVINSIIDNTSESSIKVLEDTYNIPYHHLEALGIKNKMSVSEIKHRFMDEEFEKEDEAYRPDFLKEENDDSIIPEFMGGKSEENKGALRGTAVHRVMELLPFEDDSLVNADAGKVRKAIAEMTQTGLIGEEDAKLVNPEKVALLLQNDFAKVLNTAAKEGRLHKEQPFVMSIMPRDAGIDSDSDEEILVQGIIDLFVEDEDGLILLDYKTDRVNTPDELIKRYAKQMELYGTALSKAYGKPVKNYRIYSFALTKIIDL